MRKITLALFGLFLLLATSCKKDDAEPQFELADLIGVWEVIGGTDFVNCPTGDNEEVDITSTNIRIGSADENGCSSISSISNDYEFVNGNTFQTEGFEFKVTSLNGDVMRATLTLFGFSSSYELQKQ
jgi:hypothetical protein